MYIPKMQHSEDTGTSCVSVICSHYRLSQFLIFWMGSVTVMSRMMVNLNHFLPKSLIDATMWYISSSMSRKWS